MSDDTTQTSDKINVGSTGPVADSKHLPDSNGDAKGDAKVADAHEAALQSQKKAHVEKRSYSVSEGVPAGVKPAEAIFTPGDDALIEKEGAWYPGRIVAVTPIGIPDQLTGEKVKYTVSYGAVNGVSNHTPEQYVPQSRVKAVDADIDEDDTPQEAGEKADLSNVAPTDASDVHKDVEARKKAAAMAEGRYPTAEELEAAKKAGDETQPGSPANNPDLNGAIDDPSKGEVENFNGDEKEQAPNTTVNPGGSVSVDTDPENQVRVSASDTTPEGAINPSASTAHDTLDPAGLKAKQEQEAKEHEKEVAKEEKAEKAEEKKD